MTAQHTSPQQGQEVPIIPARRNGVTMLCVHTFLATIAGLALRLVFVFRFPTSAGDSETYLQLARNWTDHHVYGLWFDGHLIPTDLRMPGYPAFLAGVAMLLGRSNRAILLSQALLDIGTCYLTATLAAALAPVRDRRVVWIAGIWIAGTCPFVANYTAVVLTEVLVAFFSTAALVCFVLGLRQNPLGVGLRVDSKSVGRKPRLLLFAALGAFLTGVATLVRPEMPLLLITVAVVYGLRWWTTLGFRKMALLGALMGGAFLLPLLPWAARNYVTLQEAQILAPRYAVMPAEYAPLGFYAWTKTWLERYRDVYSSIWALGEDPIAIDDLPATAFDSSQEKERVAALLNLYNTSDTLDISPEMDREFGQIARERTMRHPFRTFVQVPFQRALTIWFTPRTELLPIDGKIWPLQDQWEDSHADVLTTAGLAALGYLYAFLALGGLFVGWRASFKGEVSTNENSAKLWGISLLLVYLFIRTIFLTTVEAPEPRYVISCYAALLALVALLFTWQPRKKT